MPARDLAVVAGAFSFFIARGEPGTEDTLIRALNQHGDVNMAGSFLSCGNKKLDEAARAWAYRHNYRVESIPAAVRYGSGRDPIGAGPGGGPWDFFSPGREKGPEPKPGGPETGLAPADLARFSDTVGKGRWGSSGTGSKPR